MVTVVMAGGHGRRLAMRGREKPLVSVQGRPLVDRVTTVLRACGERELFVAVSRHTPRTEAYCRAVGLPTVRTPGDGYSADVRFLSRRLAPFDTIAADLPFLPLGALERFRHATHRRRGNWVGLLPERLAINPGTTALRWPEPIRSAGVCRIVGVNRVASREPGPSRPFLFDDPWVGVNVNAREDLHWARHHAAEAPPLPL